MKTIYSVDEYALPKWARYVIPILLAVVAVLVVVTYVIDFDAPWFNKPNLFGVIVIDIILAIIILIALFLKVKVEIDGSEIRVKCFRTKVIKKKDIESAVVKEVNPVKEFGGWGYRIRKGKRAIITADTNMGVYMVIKGQPDLFVSSKEPERLLRAIKGQN